MSHLKATEPPRQPGIGEGQRRRNGQQLFVFLPMRGKGRLDRIEGRVEFVDSRRGTFEIRDSRNRLVVVSVPFNAPRAVTDRFNRLRSGDNVRIEGRSVSADRFDLESFL